MPLPKLTNLRCFFVLPCLCRECLDNVWKAEPLSPNSNRKITPLVSVRPKNAFNLPTVLLRSIFNRSSEPGFDLHISGGIAILLGFLQAHEIVGVFWSPNLISILQLNAVGIAIVPDLEDLPTWKVRLRIYTGYT